MPRKQPPPTPDEERVSLSSVPVEQLLTLLESGDWEKFLEEAAEGADPQYAHVDRMGGAGDGGRDLVCYVADDRSTSEFDLIQCKRYRTPLGPATISAEVGKLCVNTWKQRYKVPRRYYFAAPHNLTPASLDLLADPAKLRARLIADWPKHVENEVSTAEPFPLQGDLRTYVDAFDFKIISHLPVRILIAQHRRTPHWYVRFKRDPPERSRLREVPPERIAERELPYVTELLAAYGQHAARIFSSPVDLTTEAPLDGHFKDCRVDFYMAESLARFYRDKSFPGAFEALKEDLHDGIKDVVASDHATGYRRLLATLAHVVTVQLPDTHYCYCVWPTDRKGICHHLVNDMKVRWVR